MLEKAVMGDVEQVVADEIVESFIRKYGNEAYRTARDAMLKSVVPDAQTEGLIRGNGSGMDDQGARHDWERSASCSVSGRVHCCG